MLGGSALVAAVPGSCLRTESATAVWWTSVQSLFILNFRKLVDSWEHVSPTFFMDKEHTCYYGLDRGSYLKK